MFTGQPLFYQIIVTLSVFSTLSTGDISVCEYMEPKREDMIRHVYVYGDSSDDIQLKCPAEDKLFIWDKLSFGAVSGNYDTIWFYFIGRSDIYSASGNSTEDYALNIGKPNKNSSGIYCCIKNNGTVPYVSHAVLVLPKAPEITLTSSKTNHVENGDEISLKCVSSYNEANGYLEPEIIWEKNYDEVRGAKEVEHKFKVTPEDHYAVFRCGLRYENLVNNGGSRTFYSDPVFLTIEQIDPRLCTDNRNRIEVSLGNSTTLTCVFKASPQLNHEDLSWTKRPLLVTTDNGDIPILFINTNDTGNKYELMMRHEDNFKTTFSLTINNFTEEDTAAYGCNLRNKLQKVFIVQDPENCPVKSARSPSIILRVNCWLHLILVSLLTAALLLA